VPIDIVSDGSDSGADGADADADDGAGGDGDGFADGESLPHDASAAATTMKAANAAVSRDRVPWGIRRVCMIGPFGLIGRGHRSSPFLNVD
jgi:hypothetical protein